MIKLIQEGRANVEAVDPVGVRFWFMCYVPLGSGRRRYFTKVLPVFECIQHGEALTSHHGI